MIFRPTLLAYILYKPVEVKLVLVLGITRLTTQFFSGPPLSPGLRLGQGMRVVGLCSCSLHMNHGLWEGWWKDYTLPRSFIRPGLPFLTAHISLTQPRLLQSRPHGKLQHQVQGGLSKLWKCSLFMYFARPPMLLETDLTWNTALKVWKKIQVGRMPEYTLILTLLPF